MRTNTEAMMAKLVSQISHDRDQFEKNQPTVLLQANGVLLGRLEMAVFETWVKLRDPEQTVHITWEDQKIHLMGLRVFQLNEVSALHIVRL